MPKKLRYTPHALQRLAERGIRRRWAAAVLSSTPIPHGRHAAFMLTAEQLRGSFGRPFGAGLRVVVDQLRAVVITVHWMAGSAA